MHHAQWMMENCPSFCGICDAAEGAMVPGTPADGQVGSSNPPYIVKDDVLTEDECDMMTKLSYFTLLGDGYQGRHRPFSSTETFAGLTPEGARDLLSAHPELQQDVELYYNASERMLEVTRQAYALPALYYHYTHLVVRTNTNNEAGSELSHPIHGDNCVPVENVCARVAPAYVDRDYSAILFLNQDYSGGEFFFSDDYNGTKKEYIEPRCGRLVAFPANVLHGVEPLGPRARRAVIAHWYTTKADQQQDVRRAFGPLVVKA